MKQVYLISHSYSYEGSTVLNVCATIESARKILKTYVKRHDDMKEIYTDCFANHVGDGYRIYPMKLE